jgi:hypothetical protein
VLQVYFLSVFQRNRIPSSDPVSILCETTCAYSALHAFAICISVIDTNKPIFLNLSVKGMPSGTHHILILLSTLLTWRPHKLFSV